MYSGGGVVRFMNLLKGGVSYKISGTCAVWGTEGVVKYATSK
jgi:hypothetical protein